MANFEVFLWNISSSINLFFLKSDIVCKDVAVSLLRIVNTECTYFNFFFSKTPLVSTSALGRKEKST